SMLNAGRSVGDELNLMSMRLRLRWADACVNSLERVLGQAVLNVDMRALQDLIGDEVVQPLFLIGIRGERAMNVQMLEMLIAGEVDFDKTWRAMCDGKMTSKPLTSFTAAYYWLYRRSILRSEAVDYIEQSSELIEQLKGPPR